MSVVLMSFFAEPVIAVIDVITIATTSIAAPIINKYSIAPCPL
jgi:hypothetical protein